MSILNFSLLTCVLFLSSLFTVTSAIDSSIRILSLRQTQSDQAICSEYSTIANLSIVGSNSTYRAAYIQSSPEGTDPTTAPLDNAISKLPSFEFDSTINRECGNLTEVAIEGAATNFTNGVVLQFNINSAVQIGAKSTGMAMIMAMVVAAAVHMI